MLFEPRPKIVEYNGIKCSCRPGSADEMIFHENIVKGEVSRHLEVGPGQLWLDLGGFIGTFALYVRQQGAQVTSVEADPDNAECYIRNMELNGLEPKPLLICGAVVQDYPPSGMVTLHMAKRYGGLTRAGGISGKGVTNWAVNTLYSKWKTPHPTKDVPAVDFAKLVASVQEDYEPKSLCLKADIEGAEVDILERGDLSMFDKMFFEYHYQAGGGAERAAKVFDRIRSLGFQLRLNHPPKPGGKTWWNQTYHLGWAWRR